MYDESTYEHNKRMKRLMGYQKIREEEDKLWDCDRNVCYQNLYNNIDCSECDVFKHNNKIKKNIKRIKERMV